MTEFLRSFQQWLQNADFLMMGGLIMARILPVMLLAPFLGGKLAPAEVKIGLGIWLTILIWPLVDRTQIVALPMGPIVYPLLMMKEIFIGFIIGFVSSHIFTIMEMTGRWIDTARGSSMSEVLVPESGQRATPIGDLYYQLLLVIFMAVGAYGPFLEAFFFSFARIPIGAGIPVGVDFWPMADYMIRLTADILLASLLLSAPVVAAVLITDIVFGLLNRVAPQLNAYFMSMPVKAMGGIAITLVIMDAFVEQLYAYSVWSLQTIEKSWDLLAR